MKPYLPVLLFTASATLSWAQITVNYGAYPGDRNVVDSLSVAVPDGNEVRLGFWDSSFDVAANAGNLPALQAAWHQFDNTTTITLSATGQFADFATKNDPTFDNQKISLWIFKTSDSAAPSGDFSNVQQYGIFSSTSTTWRFVPHDTTPPNNTMTVSSDQVNQAFWGGVIGDPATGQLQLAAVPEPEQYAMVISVALVGLVFWRRRARSGRFLACSV